MRNGLFGLMVLILLAWGLGAFAVDPPKLQAGKKFTIQFPDMPKTFQAQVSPNGQPAMMTVFLPTNYDPQRKHPLLIFLDGGDGGAGSNPSIARALTEEKDFICVGLPLFKADIKDLIVRDNDCKLMWPLYKTMLTKLTDVVPNIDPAHRVLGGFSNGAHTTGGLIDNSDGEAAKWFTAFFFIEGGGNTKRYDLIKGKPLLICYGYQPGRERTRARVQEFGGVASDAGARVSIHEMKDTGHNFPPAEYPFMRQWLHEVAMQ